MTIGIVQHFVFQVTVVVPEAKPGKQVTRCHAPSRLGPAPGEASSARAPMR
jgi:hypothetical protein